MAKNPIGFMITDESAGWNEADFDDVFVRKDCFLEGGLWMWGLGSSGTLGTNNSIPRSSPVQTVSGGTNWKSVATNCIISAGIKTDGTLWLWGSNGGGSVGDAASGVPRSSPVQTASGGTNWRKVSLGWCHSAAIKSDGTLWIWGTGACGRLGNNSVINVNTPVQTIAGGNDWKQVSLGVDTSAAIKTDGTLWTWGYGFAGRLANNTFSNFSSPVQTASGGNDWKQVSMGAAFGGAVKTDGTLWTWGYGPYRGDNSMITTSSPVQTVSGGTNWKSIAAGSFAVAAIKTDGTLWLWGLNACGSLGDGTVIRRSSPVQTVSGGTNWRCVSVNRSVAAIKTDGTLWVWGCNQLGSLGTENRISYSSPVQTISGGTGWASVEIGGLNTIALREDCW